MDIDGNLPEAAVHGIGEDQFTLQRAAALRAGHGLRTGTRQHLIQPKLGPRRSARPAAPASCPARRGLLADMTPVARRAAAIATAMMASATSTSIRVKPRWRSAGRGSSTDVITAGGVALQGDAGIPRVKRKRHWGGDPFGVEDKRSVGIQPQLDHPGRPGLRAQHVVVFQVVDGHGCVFFRAGGPAGAPGARMTSLGRWPASGWGGRRCGLRFAPP